MSNENSRSQSRLLAEGARSPRPDNSLSRKTPTSKGVNLPEVRSPLSALKSPQPNEGSRSIKPSPNVKGVADLKSPHSALRSPQPGNLGSKKVSPASPGRVGRSPLRSPFQKQEAPSILFSPPSPRNERPPIHLDLENPSGIERPKTPAKQEEFTKSYTVAEDLRVLELFKSKALAPPTTTTQEEGGEPQPRSSIEIKQATQQLSEAFIAQRNALCKELDRSYESIRDRYKRYLKYLSEEDIESIKTTAAEELDLMYIHFEKCPAGEGETPSEFKKRLKKVSKEAPRPVNPTKKKQRTPGRIIFPLGMSDYITSKKHSADRFPLTSFKRRPTSRGFTEGMTPSTGTRLPGSEAFSRKRTRIFTNDEAFDIRGFVPLEYFHKTISLAEWEGSNVTKYETRKFKEYLAGAGEFVQCAFDGESFAFDLVRRSSIKDRAPVLQSISSLLEVSREEADRIFESLSCDVDDMKAYIGGAKYLAWNPLEDHALMESLSDGPSRSRFYPLLLKEKGENSIRKRIEYLKRKSNGDLL